MSSLEHAAIPQPPENAHKVDPRQLADMFLDAYNDGRYASPEAARQAYEATLAKASGEVGYADAVVANAKAATELDKELTEKQNRHDTSQTNNERNVRTGVDTMERSS